MPQQSILITGCSSGIGLATALVLKERGYRVFAAARKVSDVEALATRGLDAVQLDINDRASMSRALETILATTGGTLDALFNNAGYLQAGAIEDLTRDLDRAQFETNVFGPMELIRLVLPIMRKQGHGRILQNSSILGVVAMPYYGAYNASKFALEGFSHTLRQELRGTNIYVSLINPGPIKSALRSHAFEHYQNTLAKQSTLHKSVYQRMEQTYFAEQKKDAPLMLEPDAVAKKVIRALESKHPRAHYYVGTPACVLAFAKRILPDSVLDWILAKIK